MHDDAKQDPFADMECDWENVEKAEAGFSSGRLPEFNAYHGVLVTFDPGAAESEEQVDHHYFVTDKGKGTKAVKIQIEVLEPEKVGEEAVKGRTHEHVFWITPKNWPYVRRDAEIILGKEIKHPKDLLSSVWAGKTLEFGVQDELYNGVKRSKTSFINAWAPPKTDKKAEKQAETKKTAAPAKTAASKPAPVPAKEEEPAF